MKTIAESMRVVEDIIYQKKLKAFSSRANKISKLEASLKKLKAAHEDEQNELLDMMDDGRPIQKGPLSLIIYFVKGQRRPKWKEEYIKEMGEEAAQRIINTTPPGKETREISVVRKMEIKK